MCFYLHQHPSISGDVVRVILSQHAVLGKVVDITFRLKTKPCSTRKGNCRRVVLGMARGLRFYTV